MTQRINPPGPISLMDGSVDAADLPSGIDAAKIGGGAVSNTEFNRLDGITAFGSSLIGCANAAAVLTAMGMTASIAQLNFVAGVTSAIQTQLDAKAPLASPTFTGQPVLPAGSKISGVYWPLMTSGSAISTALKITTGIQAASAGRYRVIVHVYRDSGSTSVGTFTLQFRLSGGAFSGTPTAVDHGSSAGGAVQVAIEGGVVCVGWSTTFTTAYQVTVQVISTDAVAADMASGWSVSDASLSSPTTATRAMALGGSLALTGALSGVTTLGMSGALSGATTGSFSGALACAAGSNIGATFFPLDYDGGTHSTGIQVNTNIPSSAAGHYRLNLQVSRSSASLVNVDIYFVISGGAVTVAQAAVKGTKAGIGYTLGFSGGLLVLQLTLSGSNIKARASIWSNVTTASYYAGWTCTDAAAALTGSLAVTISNEFQGATFFGVVDVSGYPLKLSGSPAATGGSTREIHGSAGTSSFHYNVPTGGQHNFTINGSPVVTFDVTNGFLLSDQPFKLNGSPANGAGSERYISGGGSSGDMTFNIPTGAGYYHYVNNSLMWFQNVNYTREYGGKVYPINATAKTTTYTVLTSDRTVKCDTTGGGFTVTLFATPIQGAVITIKNIAAANNVTVAPAAGNIEGAGSVTVGPGLFKTFQYDGTAWWQIG